MENIHIQDTNEDNPFLCFQRTPSLRRKWRKRYGGLDGNKLLEPNKEEETQENGLMKESHLERNSSVSRSTEKQDTYLPSNNSSLKKHSTPQPQKPVNLVIPGTAVVPAYSSNGSQRSSLSPGESVQGAHIFWHNISKSDSLQLHSRKKVAADVLFESFASEGRVGTSQFFEAIWSSGIRKTDPRIKDCYSLMRKLQQPDVSVDRNTFHRCVTGFVSFILKALQGRFVIPDFPTFAEETQRIFMKCKQLTSFKPELNCQEENSQKWGVSICTVDGQRLSLGDSADPCLLGECSWPLMYGIAVDQFSVDHIHRYVGMEEYSKYDSSFVLTKNETPHTPLIETGAIIIASLLQLATGLGGEDEEKYETVLNLFRRLCNKEHANLNCSRYQYLQKENIRLHALSYFLQEKKCFPDMADIGATLDLLLQCLSTEMTCDSGAVLAASLANGGLCPLSGDQVLSSDCVRNTLSVMQVAGMNDYSRTFHFKTSLPAMSSKNGTMQIVVPGVMGIMCWSTQLDTFGNSLMGVHFCQELVTTFQLHSFDIRTPFRQVVTYRQWKAESEGYQIMNILLAAYRGDVLSLRRYLLSGADVNCVDYDGRSALHVAASEGHVEVIKFLVENAGADYMAQDRWGNTPLQEATKYNNAHAVQLLKRYKEQHRSL
ncbi:glutaminase liver isoform, mitochondrial [Polypterus senegalus]|uniref:glutaminase liver isoform, mitochondrial n=1 Tax=Polypterus senegalus TaxID=55291 RepID=UPI0019663FC9|nr:glutaminase liver isoform, mitochondrial [Polypterus senegalus]